jgi:thiopurine S-methyltransferase
MQNISTVAAKFSDEEFGTAAVHQVMHSDSSTNMLQKMQATTGKAIQVNGFVYPKRLDQFVSDCRKAEIVHIDRLTDKVRSITFRVDGEDTLFWPGQHLILHRQLPKMIVAEEGYFFPGMYSIVSSPSQLPLIEIAVSQHENPRNLGHYLFYQAKIGDTLWCYRRGQGQHLALNDDILAKADSLLLLGGGSAITPLISIVRHLVESSDLPVTLIASARGNEILFRNEMKSLETLHPQLQAIYTRTGEIEAFYRGRRGRIDRQLVEQHLDLSGRQHIYIAGQSGFAKAMVDILRDVGVDFSRVHCEYPHLLTRASNPLASSTGSRPKTPDDWADDFKNDNVCWQSPIVSPLLRKYRTEFLGDDAVSVRILVPLSGISLDLLYIARLPEVREVIGAEYSDLACRRLFETAGIGYKIRRINAKIAEYISTDKDAPLRIFQGDFFELDSKLIGRVDRVFDRAAYVALPYQNTELKERYIRKIANMLTPDGLMLFASMAQLPRPPEQQDIHIPPFCYRADEVAKAFSPHFEEIRFLETYAYRLQAGVVKEPYYLLRKADRAKPSFPT